MEAIAQFETKEDLEFQNLLNFPKEDSTFYDFPKVEAGGSRSPEPPKTNPPCNNPPSPRPKFKFIANMTTNKPCLVADAIAVPCAQHPLPKHLEKLLPKFDLDNDITPEDHIKKFILSLIVMDVKHKYVVCMLFLYTFVGKYSTWFFSLTVGSITSWQQFETTFLSQFRDDKTSRVLLLDLSRLKFDKKDKVKDFNQIFINLLNRIPDKPVKSVRVEFYTVALPPPIVMFFKAKEMRTLTENFLEVVKVEKYLASISSHQGNKENKPSLLEKSMKKDKGISKLDSEKKEKEPMDMESMHRVIKKLTNKIIYLKKKNGEGKKPFKPFMKKRTNCSPQTPPTLGINLEYYEMEN
jgi:hypothetical protein